MKKNCYAILQIRSWWTFDNSYALHERTVYSAAMLNFLWNPMVNVNGPLHMLAKRAKCVNVQLFRIVYKMESYRWNRNYELKSNLKYLQLHSLDKIAYSIQILCYNVAIAPFLQYVNTQRFARKKKSTILEKINMIIFRNHFSFFEFSVAFSPKHLFVHFIQIE